MPAGIANARRAARRRRRAKEDYHISILYGGLDGGYIADIQHLEACFAFGASSEEARREVAVAGAAWMEVDRTEGKPVRKPRCRPAIHQRTS